VLEVIGENPDAGELFVVADYERRNRVIAPVIHCVLSRLVGWRYDGTPDAQRRLLAELPVIAFGPIDS
jgi:hypothetical protein